MQTVIPHIDPRSATGIQTRAGTEGITRMLAYVSADNHPVLSWIARAGGIVGAYGGDATLDSIPLDSILTRRRAA